MMPIRSPIRSPIYNPIYTPTISRYGSGADILLASMGLSSAANVVALDFVSGTGRIRDATTVANNWSGAISDKLTYSAPSAKYRRGANGVLNLATGILPEYDINGQNIGYRSEPQDINRLLWSSDLSNAAWTRTSMPTAPVAALGPDGAMSAWVLTDDQAGAYSSIEQSTVVAANSLTHQVRVRIKKTLAASTAIPGLSIYLTGGTAVSAFPRVDPYTGTGALGAVVTDMGEWWEARCPITNNGTNTTLNVRITPAVRTTVGGADTAAAVGSNTFWCPQAGDNFVASSPIMTDAAQVTRAADNLSLDGSLFPIPSSGGMMVVDWTPALGASSGGIALINTASGTTEYVDIRSAASIAAYVTAGGVVSAFFAGSDLRGVRNKTALRWKNNSARMASNGALVGGHDTTVALPTGLDKLTFALNGNTGYLFNGWLRSLVVVSGTDFTDADIMAASTL